MRPHRTWILLAATVLLLAGCSGFVDQDQPHVDSKMGLTLEPGHAVGQTFVARHAGLSGVDVWLRPEPGPSNAGEIYLHLRADPQTNKDLATAVLPLAQVTSPGFYRLSFAPAPDSHNRYYYAFLETTGDGAIGIGDGPGETYLDGAMYSDHRPLDTQMAFRLAYDLRWMLLDVGSAAVSGLGLLLVAGLLYVVPGGALLAWLRPGDQISWVERLALSAGLSLALYPLLFLWTNLVGLRLGRLYAWLPVVGGLIALSWRYRAWRPRKGWQALHRWALSDALWPNLALLIIMGFAFTTRLLVVRTLDAPMWGDSYQHTVIAQLMVDQGGLFDSWKPYAPYRTLTVHFGFPAAVAPLAWATGMESPQATLLAGQLINGLAVLALYPLAMRVAGKDHWAGVGAVLVAGLLSPMPAYYVNWGRYAQLAGQAILPVAIWLLWDVAQSDHLSWKTTLLAGTAVAGMSLAYYRMPFYYIPFILAWLIGWGLPHWREKIRDWLRGLARLALIGGIALLLVLPWGLQVAGGQLAMSLGTGISSSSSWEHVISDYQVWRDIAFHVPPPLLIAALVALALSLLHRRWDVALVGLWTLGMASLVASSLIRLPGANMMQNFAILIALYIPVGLLVGWLIGQGARLAQTWAGKAGQIATALTIVALGVWAGVGQIGIVRPQFVMVTRPDVRAMGWIRENTPSEARFLVEGFRIYGGYTAVGADAGWWIPLLADRENTMPPQYALMNEVPVDAGYTRRVVDLVAHLENTPPDSPEWIQPLCDWDISYVYVGQGQGWVGAGAGQLFSPADLAANPAFSTVYHRDRVYIFDVNPRACEAGGK